MDAGTAIFMYILMVAIVCLGTWSILVEKLGKKHSDVVTARGILFGVLWPITLIGLILYGVWKIVVTCWWVIKTAMKKVK